MEYKNILCIVPARAGSKGVPNKNIRHISGIPLFYHSVLHALNANIPIDNIIVSSDCCEVQKYCNIQGVKCRIRPSELSTDTATTESALLDAIEYNNNYYYDGVLLLQPTSPIRYSLSQCLDWYYRMDCDSLITVTKMSSIFWKENNNGFHPKYDIKNRPRKQDMTIESFNYYENGNVYITNMDILLSEKCRIGKKPVLFPISELESFQIDTEEEFETVKNIIELFDADKRKKANAKKYECPECHKITDGNIHENCDMVLGRRGWRQLGVYDG